MVSWQIDCFSASLRLAAPASLIWLKRRSSEVSWQVGFFSASIRLATPSSVIWLPPRYSVVSWQVDCFSTSLRLATPSLVIWLSARSSVVSWQVDCFSASLRLATPSSVIWLPPRPSVVSWQVDCFSASLRVATPSSVISLTARSSVVSWQFGCFSASLRLATPSSVILLLPRPSVVSWQVDCFSASLRVATPSSVISLTARSSVVSWQFGCFSASLRLATPASVISLPPRCSVVSWQVGCFSASLRLATPSSVISLPPRFILSSLVDTNMLICGCTHFVFKPQRHRVNVLTAQKFDCKALHIRFTPEVVRNDSWIKSSDNDWFEEAMPTSFIELTTSNKNSKAIQSTSLMPPNSLLAMYDWRKWFLASSLSLYSQRHCACERSSLLIGRFFNNSTISLLSFVFDKMPAMNCKTIIDTSSGISLLFTNERAAKYSWTVKWVKQKYFVVWEIDIIKGGPQCRSPPLLRASTSISSKFSRFISSSVNSNFRDNSDWAAKSDSLSRVLSPRTVCFFLMWFLSKTVSTSE